jgi:hypothetical protein
MKRNKSEPEEESFWDRPAFEMPTKRRLYIALAISTLAYIIFQIAETQHWGQTQYKFYFTEAERRQGYPEYEMRWK